MRSLAIRRRYRGLTQAELAGRTGVSVWKISRFELGRGIPEMGELRRLAEALGIATEGLRRSQIEVRLRLNRDELARFEVPGRSRRGWKRSAPQVSLPDWFLGKLPSPGPLMATWMGQLAGFAEAESQSPFLCGFVSSSLLDSRGSNVGITPLPCLRWKAQPGQSVIRLWPQLFVRSHNHNRTYGVAGLVNMELGLKSAWAFLDLPEAHSEFDWDPAREANLPLTRLVFTRQQILQGSWKSELERNLAALLPLSEPNLEALFGRWYGCTGKML